MSLDNSLICISYTTTFVIHYFSVYMVILYWQTCDELYSKTIILPVYFFLQISSFFFYRSRYGHSFKRTETSEASIVYRPRKSLWISVERWDLKCFDAFRFSNCCRIMRINSMLQTFNTEPRPIVQNSSYGT